MRYRWSVRLERKLQDAWVGVYWSKAAWNIDIWICLVPCLPIHVYRRLYSVEHG